jgi:predicted transcriptional regulator
MVKIMSISRKLPIVYDLSSIPVLEENASLKKCLDLMSKLGKGISVLVDKENKIKGVLTDGDLRRLLLTHQSPLPSLLITDGLNFGSKDPVVCMEDSDWDEVMKTFKVKHISQILVIDQNRKILGYINGYDLI